MPDPREQIPDVIHVAADGTRWLIRTEQQQSRAKRDEPIYVGLDFKAHPIAAIDAHGRARILPGDGIGASKPYGLGDLPPELAEAMAAWMASEARTSGLPLLLPVIDPQGTTDDP
jgi:beta-glucosidase-like glycosyl hydrolase